MTFAPAARFGPYEVTSIVGTGGMGQVYCARDARLGRNVALKVDGSRSAEIIAVAADSRVLVEDWSRDGRLALLVGAEPKTAVPRLGSTQLRRHLRRQAIRHGAAMTLSQMAPPP